MHKSTIFSLYPDNLLVA